MKVKKLPVDARSKLQSGVIITDAIQCILELVRNSLDAEATGIAVRVDLKAYQIRVIDNGKGIGKDDLEFVGERFMTSKYCSLDEMETSFPTYGYRGQALSSLQDVSRYLTIETKSEDGGSTFIKVFKNGKASPITETNSERSGTGTIVTIDDFMYSMPVRQKRINEVFDMEEIKNQLQYLAIIHYNVCFTLRNENKGLILLQTPQASSLLESISNLYGKGVAKCLHSLNYEEKKYKITGYISLKPQTQCSVQLLYVNKRIISKGVVHKFLNSLLKEYCENKSLFKDSPTGHILKKLKTSHNIYIIQIKCPHSYFELFTNIRKTTVEFKNWKDALKCVHRAVRRTFKTVLSLDSSSSTQNHEEKNITQKDKRKGVFGTSLLLNAVRGAPAKRNIRRQNTKNKKKIKLNNSKVESDALLLKKSLEHNKPFEPCNASFYKNDCINDSLESPIPKKILHVVKQDCHSEPKKSNFNQSFFEFYGWLKEKFEKDTNAFNLYNEFLQFKNKTSDLLNVNQFKSPVIGGKLKKKSVLPKNNILDKKRKTPSRGFSVIDEEIAIVTKENLKIYPNQQFNMKKAIQFTTEMSTDITETLNYVRNENVEKQNDELFKKPETLTFGKHQNKIEHSLSSMPSSEVQFTNVIKFRNLSESFFRQTSDSHAEAVPENNSSNTWLSHYQNFSRDAKFYRKDLENFNFHVNDACRENVNFERFNEPEKDFIEISCKTKEAVARDEGVQVNITVFRADKFNVLTQTSHLVPESPSSVNSFVFNEENGVTEFHNSLTKKQINQEITIQEVPNPDFWNESAHMQNEVNNQPVLVSEGKIISNKSDNDTQKNLTSNEFLCGHKSQSSTKVESTSKETQTLAALWTDSLVEMGCPLETVGAAKENFQASQPTTISKTIPIEDIDSSIGLQKIESGFCMTERHDFVPKGLSPQFLQPKTTKILSLSPHEKSKIKLTIDNTQNDLLATIKWQNESTGDCSKPNIPDGIIYEMRHKAGEDLMNYENPVLSATLSYCAIKVHNLLHSFAFTKELLSAVEILGQLDKKFIVARMKVSTPKKMELISLFDQHAVDERIKLEELINENVLFEGKFISSPLNPPVECVLTEFDVGVVLDLKEKMLNFGIRAEPITENALVVSEVPTYLLKIHENNLRNKKDVSLPDVVKVLLLNIIEETRETRGAVSKIPRIMHNAFCLEACHKAIKFNKALSVESMTEMINKLQSCRLPFQCAHGRPSVIPIIDLEDFTPTMEDNENSDFQKLIKWFKERNNSSQAV